MQMADARPGRRSKIQSNGNAQFHQIPHLLGLTLSDTLGQRLVSDK